MPLLHLKKLEFCGYSRNVFWLFYHLDYPAYRVHPILDLLDRTVKDISETIGSYIRDYLQRRGRSRGLGLYLYSDNHTRFAVDDVGGTDYPTHWPAKIDVFVDISIWPNPSIPKDLLRDASLDLTAEVPKEEVLYLHSSGHPIPTEGLFSRSPSIRVLHFTGTSLCAAFSNQTPTRDEGIPSSLKHLIVEHTVVCDWSPLMAFLAHHTACGNKLNTLKIISPGEMLLEVKESIRGLVRELTVVG